MHARLEQGSVRLFHLDRFENDLLYPVFFAGGGASKYQWDLYGGVGYTTEFPVERYLRNSKAAVIYEGTSQLHTLIQADYALGYREDRPLRCEAWPAQGFERG